MNKLYLSVNIILLLLFNFFLGFASDGVLNIFSQKFKAFASFRPYFKHYKTLPAMVYAGLTVMIVSLIMVIFYAAITRQLGKISIDVHILYFLLLSFVFGFIFDLIINKARIFGGWLDKFYQTVTDLGSAAFGGLALLFITSISLIIIYFIKKI